jgi:hypothetical protein
MAYIVFTEEERMAFVAWIRNDGDRNEHYKIIGPAIDKLINKTLELVSVKNMLSQMPLHRRVELMEDIKIYVITKIEKFRCEDDGFFTRDTGSKISMESYYSTIIKGMICQGSVKYQKEQNMNKALSEFLALGLDPAVYDVLKKARWQGEWH